MKSLQTNKFCKDSPPFCTIRQDIVKIYSVESLRLTVQQSTPTHFYSKLCMMIPVTVRYNLERVATLLYVCLD